MKRPRQDSTGPLTARRYERVSSGATTRRRGRERRPARAASPPTRRRRSDPSTGRQPDRDAPRRRRGADRDDRRRTAGLLLAELRDRDDVAIAATGRPQRRDRIHRVDADRRDLRRARGRQFGRRHGDERQQDEDGQREDDRNGQNRGSPSAHARLLLRDERKDRRRFPHIERRHVPL